jgi:hypothetical protein
MLIEKEEEDGGREVTGLLGIPREPASNDQPSKFGISLLVRLGEWIYPFV